MESPTVHFLESICGASAATVVAVARGTAVAVVVAELCVSFAEDVQVEDPPNSA